MRIFTTTTVPAAAIAVTLALAGCGGGATHATTASLPASEPASTTAISGHTTVAIRNFMFSPMHLTVRVGTRVTFHNYDQTAHTATALDGGFDTGTVKPGTSATVTMTKAGTYRYHCLFHAFMVASITVVQ